MPKLRIKDIDDSNFEKAVPDNGVAVLDFYADWCMPCRMMGPVFESLSSELDGSVVMGRVNVDKAPQTASRFSVAGVPTFLFFKDGQPADRIVGVTRKSQLKSKIMNMLDS